MATSIFFDGKTTTIPGAYTKIDASGLDSVGVGATGIVALIGTGVGGRPVDDGTTKMTRDDLLSFITPQAVRNTFSAGDLREAGSMVFNPSTDPDIPGGAAVVVCLKVNPSTQASLTVADIDGGTALTLTSRDYGAFTEEINVTIADDAAVSESINAKLITVKNAETTETYTNVGEVASGETQMLTLRYDEPTSADIAGWTTMTSEIINVAAPAISGLRANGGITLTGTTAITGTGTVSITSGVLNAGKVVHVFGTVAGPVYGSAAIALDADGVGSTATVFLDIYGIYSAALGQDVTIAYGGGGGDTLTAATNVLGGLYCQTMTVANTTVALGAGGAGYAVLYGLNASGAAVSERVAPSATSVSNFSRIDFIGLEGLSGGTPTLSGVAALSNNAVQSGLTKVRDYYNARQVAVASAIGTYSGFTLVVKSTQLTLNPGLLDVTAAALDCVGVAKGFPAILHAVVTQLNASALVSAARGTTNKRPADLSPAAFLSGGIEGEATPTHYQTAIDLLRTIDVSTIVPLTGSPAIHDIVKTHCAYMGGAGRSERDAVVGLVAITLGVPDVPFALATKTSIKDQLLALNTRHLRGCGQTISRFDTTGTLTTFPPYFQAVIAAGMQAGSTVGTSLTRKILNVATVAQDATWSPSNNSDEMIRAGLWFAEAHRTGIRCVRNVTTYLQDNNVAFTEASVNEAANFAVFNFRNQLEKTVGQKGFAGTLAAARTASTQILNLMVTEGVITQYRSLTIELNVDTLVVAVEIAPIIPVNFVTATVHLVTVPLVG